LPGLYASPWYALWAPKSTPRDVIGKLNAAVVEALADTSVRARFADLALQIFPREQRAPPHMLRNTLLMMFAFGRH